MVPGHARRTTFDALEIVTYDGERFWVGDDEEEQLDQIIAAGGRKGEVYRRLRDLRDRYLAEIRTGYPSVTDLPRRVSGFNLDELLPEKGFNVARALVGTESTCVTVLQARLKLCPGLFERTLVTVAYDTIADAGDDVPHIVDRFRPIGLEGVDRRLIDDQRELGMNASDLTELPRHTSAGGWLLVQFGAEAADESSRQAREFTEWLTGERGYDKDRVVVMKSKQDGGSSEDLWAIRESGLGSTAFPPDGKDHWPGWEDSAVPPAKVGPYLRDLQALYDRYGLAGALYGHFGQGCVHSRISFDLRTADGLASYRSFMSEAADLVVSYGGSLSGEHGDGQQKAELLVKQYGEPLLSAMREFKRIWDPTWSMNPGKVVDAYRMDENLKLGVDYNPARPPVRFSYAEDGGDFAHAALRCVGVGKCRVPEADATMCPSYRATRDEQHSTRGRARLLFEMLRGETITDGWQSREVFDALDLCLACKGCTNDCPVNVDMPTYKAEFLVPPLRLGPALAAPLRLRLRVHRPVGGTGQPRPGAGQLDHADSRPGPGGEVRGRHRPAPHPADVRADDAAAVVHPPRRHPQPGRTAGRAVPGHVQQPPAHRRRRRLRRSARGRRLAGDHARRARLLRPPALRLRLPRPGRALPAPGAQPRYASTSAPALRWSAWNRPAWRCSRTS